MKWYFENILPHFYHSVRLYILTFDHFIHVFLQKIYLNIVRLLILTVENYPWSVCTAVDKFRL